MRIVIAGGGLAAQRCAEALRRRGHDGPLTMVCAEDRPPYDRPPLSKELLAGTRDAAGLQFRDAGWYREQDVELLLGTRAEGLDAARRRLLTTAGELPYDRLLIATGARARTLPFLEGYDNVLTLRDVADAEALRERLAPGARVVVVGAGFIGLEVASTVTALGASATVLEAAPEPLSTVLGEELGRWFARLHRHAGVHVVCGAAVSRVHGTGSVTALELADGRRFPADLVLVAIGAVADVAWAGEVHGPDVVLAGDAAGHQHWEAAARGGAQAARVMLGEPAAPEPPSGFWSDQHGVRIQLVGEPAGGLVFEGDVEAADFSATWHRAGRPVGVLLAGRPHQLADARRLVAGDLRTERTAA